jgi:hypothetical protein
MIEDGVAGGERTYVLVLGQLERGSTRTLSILGMTTGDAKGFPDARARIEYDDAAGTHVVAAGNGTVPNAGAENGSTQEAGVAGAGGGLLPSSLIGWVLYVVIVAGAIFAIRKAREYYEARKELIDAEGQQDDSQGQFANFPPGGAPQGA